MKWLKKCLEILGGHYTLKEECHGKATHNPHPPKFDTLQTRARYRRALKGLQ